MKRIMNLRVIAFALLLGLGGCLASKGDVALLQAEVRTSRDAAAQASADQRANVDRVLAQIMRTNDSVRAISVRLAKFQGDVQTSQYEMSRQILQIQELTGQSQRRMQELRAALDERNQAVSAATSAGDTTRSTAAAPPGEAQLFQGAIDQLRRGSSGVARSGFEELLSLYPASENAPEAMVYIAETYARERNQAAADSVYALVIQKYPKSPKAATALYKRALIMKASGQTAAARAAFNRIINEFPRSDEAELAKEALRNIR